MPYAHGQIVGNMLVGTALTLPYVVDLPHRPRSDSPDTMYEPSDEEVNEGGIRLDDNDENNADNDLWEEWNMLSTKLV